MSECKVKVSCCRVSNVCVQGEWCVNVQGEWCMSVQGERCVCAGCAVSVNGGVGVCECRRKGMLEVC